MVQLSSSYLAKSRTREELRHIIKCHICTLWNCRPMKRGIFNDQLRYFVSNEIEIVPFPLSTFLWYFQFAKVCFFTSKNIYHLASFSIIGFLFLNSVGRFLLIIVLMPLFPNASFVIVFTQTFHFMLPLRKTMILHSSYSVPFEVV